MGHKKKTESKNNNKKGMKIRGELVGKKKGYSMSGGGDERGWEVKMNKIHFMKCMYEIFKE